MLSFDEGVARVTAPGQPMEVVEKIIDGVTYTVFKNAPPTLREVFDSARQRATRRSSSTRANGGASAR